jgi:hypothetical protein
MDLTQIDRSAFSVGTFADEPDDRAYWLSQKPEDRLAGIEFLRRQFYDYGKAEQEFCRFFEVAERERR